MLAFFGKSEKVLAPRKKKREREREKIENTQREYGYWSMVHGRGKSRDKTNGRSRLWLKRDVKWKNGERGKKNCKIPKFP